MKWGRVAALLAIFVPVGFASAVPIVVPQDAMDFGDLDVAASAAGPLVSFYNYNDTFTGQVISQTFLRNDGTYLYLYQADNFGPSVLEILAVSPFFDLDQTQAGALTGGEPVAFLIGGLDTLGMTYDPDVPLPNVSYNYPSWLGAHVPAGEHTKVLYLVSPNAPTSGEAYVIDSGTAVVEVFVPVPEPSVVGLLALGGVFAVGRRRNRRIK